MTGPKLRFKDSEKREFPEWEEKKLGEIALCLDSQRVPVEKNRREEGEIPYYGANGVQGYVKNWLFDGEYVLLAEDGGHYNEYSSKPIAQFIQGKAWVNNHAHIIEANDKNNTKFLFYSLEHKDIRKYINGSTRGKLTQGDMWKILLYIPSLPEQQKIADFLSTYDRQIDIQSQRVEAMKTRKKGLLQKIFSQEIRFKDAEGREFPTWIEKKLGEFFSKINKKNNDNLITNVITNSAVNGLIEQRKFFDKDIANKENTDKYYIIEKGDFVYNPRKSNDAPYGPVHMYESDCKGIVSPLYLCFKPIDKTLSLLFMKNYFKSSSWHKYIYANGDTGARDDRVSVKVTTFLDMPINIPSLPEQQKIADFFTAVDKQIEVEEKRLETMKTIKKGLLQQMFI